MRRPAESRRVVDVHPDIALVADLRLALVQADPHLDHETARPYNERMVDAARLLGLSTATPR